MRLLRLVQRNEAFSRARHQESVIERTSGKQAPKARIFRLVGPHEVEEDGYVQSGPFLQQPALVREMDLENRYFFCANQDRTSQSLREFRLICRSPRTVHYPDYFLVEVVSGATFFGVD